MVILNKVLKNILKNPSKNPKEFMATILKKTLKVI